MTQYLSCAETAKLIRQSLKEAFPGIKFSVKSNTYAGGASVNVGWIDGPNANQVEAIAKRFSGAYFDGSIDYKGYTKSMIDGQVVSFGADYVFCNRKHSRQLCAKIAARFAHFGKLEVKGSDDMGCWIDAADHSAAELARRALAKHSDRLVITKSKTAGKVIYFGNDGYSDVGALQVE